MSEEIREENIYIVEDDLNILLALSTLFESVKLKVFPFTHADSFLQHFKEQNILSHSCILLDIRLPHLSGFEIFKILKENKVEQPVIFMSAHNDIDVAISSLKLGAFDFITKPFNHQALLDTVQRALLSLNQQQSLISFKEKLTLLSKREKEIFLILLEGKKIKEIGFALNISPSTVEIHRANLFKKLGIFNLSELFKFLPVKDIFDLA